MPRSDSVRFSTGVPALAAVAWQLLAALAAPAASADSCPETERTVRFGFYAYFEPVSHSAGGDPVAPGFDDHRGYEADLLTAIEAMEGVNLSFLRRGIAAWEDIWLLPVGPDSTWRAGRDYRSRHAHPRCRRQAGNRLRRWPYPVPPVAAGPRRKRETPVPLRGPRQRRPGRRHSGNDRRGPTAEADRPCRCEGCSGCRSRDRYTARHGRRRWRRRLQDRRVPERSHRPADRRRADRLSGLAGRSPRIPAPRQAVEE